MMPLLIMLHTNLDYITDEERFGAVNKSVVNAYNTATKSYITLYTGDPPFHPQRRK